MLKKVIQTILFSGILLMPLAHLYADSPAKLISQGNTAYIAGKYDEALSAYDEASVDAPESPHIYFNKGTALYQKGDYAGAEKAFEKAALKSKDIHLEADCKFNLGNCAYREAERQQDSDMNKALEACGKSIQHYQEALELDPDFTEAAENIEVVRLVMKSILDEINKQKEAQKQQQEAMQKTEEQLKQIIEKQKDVLNRNQKLEVERDQKGDSQGLNKKIQDLSQDQKDLQKQTEELAENLPKTGGQNATPAESPTEKHLKNAAKEQQAASGNLDQKNTGTAKNNQEKALKELEDALDSLSDKQQCNKDQQQKQQQQEGSQPKQEPESSNDESSQDQEGQEKSQETMAQMSDDAHDILDEEKENKKQRMSQPSGGYKDVERDW